MNHQRKRQVDHFEKTIKSGNREKQFSAEASPFLERCWQQAQRRVAYKTKQRQEAKARLAKV